MSVLFTAVTKNGGGGRGAIIKKQQYYYYSYSYYHNTNITTDITIITTIRNKIWDTERAKSMLINSIEKAHHESRRIIKRWL